MQGSHQALISESVFYRVQNVLDGKKKIMRTKIKVDDKFPLRGFLICPQCGKLLTASSSKGRSSYYHYYHCFSGCNVRFKSDVVNDRFIKELSRWKPKPAVGDLYKIVLQDIYRQSGRVRQSRLNKLREDISRLSEYKIRIRKMRISDELAADDYHGRKNRLRKPS